MSVETVRTKYGRRVTGLCSSHLATLLPGDTVKVWIRSGAYRSIDPPPANILAPPLSLPLHPDLVLPRTDSTSMILIGPGTGIAPLRAIIQQQIYSYLLTLTRQMSTASASTSMPYTTPHICVFYGCRKREQDYLYRIEWSEIKHMLHTILQNQLLTNGHNSDPSVSIAHSEYHKRFTDIWSRIQPSSEVEVKVEGSAVVSREDDHCSWLEYIPAFSQDQEEKVCIIIELFNTLIILILTMYYCVLIIMSVCIGICDS